MFQLSVVLFEIKIIKELNLDTSKYLIKGKTEAAEIFKNVWNVNSPHTLPVEITLLRFSKRTMLLPEVQLTQLVYQFALF